MELAVLENTRAGGAASRTGNILQNAIGAVMAGMPIRPLSLRFIDPNLEARFRHEHFVIYLPMMRLALALGLILYPSFAVIDLYVVPDALTAAWSIRFGVVAPLLVAALLLSFHPRFEALHQFTFCLIAGAAGLGICTMMALSPPPGSHIYYVGLIIVMIYGFHFMRVRFLYATVLAWLFFAAYVVQLMLFDTAEPAILIGSVSLLAATNLVEMVAGYAQELYIRRDFLQRIRLAEGEQRLQNIAANIPGSVFRFIRHPNGNYKLHYMSEGLRHVFNRPTEKLMANPEIWDEWIHPDDREGWLLAMQKSIMDAKPFHHEMRFVGDDGEIKWMRTTGRPQARSNGDVVWDGINLDITDLKAREAELQQAQKMEALGQLTGGVAHDFNNLLTVIGGNLQLIAEDSAPDSDIGAMAEEARRAVDQGSGLTRQLLAFARRQSLAPSSIDLAELVHGMTGLLRRALGAEIEVRSALPASLPPILADSSHLQNAILNLALNAKDAMSGVGLLTLEAAATTLDANYCEAHPDSQPGDYVMLSVSDSGCGMSPEVLERVFEPFFTTKDAGSGSGLGLSMIYGFVRQTRGHVHIYSEPGQGTTVRLYLPVAHEQPNPEPAQPLTTQQGTGELILLVEDNEGVRRLARRMLDGLGYRVREAVDAADALDKLDENVDLLFTDMSMPGGMSGAELAEVARRQYPELQVLFATGYTEHSPAYEKFVECGALLLSKPYRKELLSEYVCRTLAQRDVLA